MFDTKKFVLISDNRYIDFVNTKILRNGEPADLLTSGEDFLAWALAVGLVDQSKAVDLNQKMKPKDFGEIIEFRNLLNEMTASIVTGKQIKTEYIEAINRQLQRKTGYQKIELVKGEAINIFVADLVEPLQILAPIAESAARILTEGNLDYLKKCESDECVLFFYDTSKNHSRRWCSMEACGNRAKANAFYRRKKRGRI